MDGRKVSVADLRAHWKYIETLKDDDVIEGYIHTHDMPSWGEICSELPWRFHWADSGYFSKGRHGYCGVYRLIGLESDRPLIPAAISRVCGEDVSGTLYVGEAGWLNDRLNQLRRSLHSEDTHGASRLWGQSLALRSKFPTAKLGIAIFGTGVRMHKWIEGDLIRAYLNTFGDTPPLNCSF